METTDQVELESTAASEATSTQSETADSAISSQPGSTAPVLNEDGTPAIAAYTPNFKFKVYDKEHEVPENFRGLIKDADSEKSVREIFEKAYGLDGMKPKYQKLQEKASSYEKVLNEEYQPLKNHYSNLNKFIANKDFDTLFNQAGISEADLQKWMLGKLQAQSLPPEQQAIYNKEQEQRAKLYELEAQNKGYESRLAEVQAAQTEFAVKQRTSELESALNQPDIQAVANGYEARTGNKFKDVVIKFAQAEHRATGKDMSVSEAVEAVMGLVGAAPGQAVTPNQGAQGKPPVIPNVVGKSTSPTTAKFKSVADIKKYAQSMQD